MECEAVTFLRRSTSGRSKPPLVFAEMPAGNVVEVWLKAPKLHPGISDAAPAREWMAARLAESLGLPCPLPVLVKITPDFLKSLTDAELVRALEAGPSIVYGAMHLGPGWRRWSDASKLPQRKLQLAGNAYLFDTIIQNWDRRIANPNILRKGDEFRILDHEEAFVLATGAEEDRKVSRPPWAVGGFDNYVAGTYQHPFWRHVRRSKHVDFDVAARTWKSLPPDTFSLYASEAPTEWGPDACSEIAKYLELATAHIDEVVKAIEGARML